MSAGVSQPAEWRVAGSRHAENTRNPIRSLTDSMKPPSCTKSLIKLSIGDPTFDGNLKTPEIHIEAVKRALDSYQFNGYPPSVGYDSSREAVATYWATNFVHTEQRRATIHARNVILSSGGSHAILMAITALCNPGDNLLIPSPGFPQYLSVCDSYGIEARPYHCDPARNWEIDLDELGKLTDARTKGIVLTNPSNPCGSNFCRAHVESILRKAEELRLVVFSDEIYAGMVFDGEVFTSVADIDTTVPRVILGGTAKSLFVPGWRIGWLLMVDPDNRAGAYWSAIIKLAMLLVGPNSISQAGLPQALLEVPQSFHAASIRQIEEGSKCIYNGLRRCHGILPTEPRGAMYVMAKIDVSMFADISCSMEFYEKLLDEEAVHCLPGEIFGSPNYIRLVTTRPPEVANEAMDRICSFCERHRRV